MKRKSLLYLTRPEKCCPSWWGRFGSRGSEAGLAVRKQRNYFSSTYRKQSNQEVVQGYKSLRAATSVIFSPASLKLNTSSWEPSVLIHEPMGDISYSNHSMY